MQRGKATVMHSTALHTCMYLHVVTHGVGSHFTPNKHASRGATPPFPFLIKASTNMLIKKQPGDALTPSNAYRPAAATSLYVLLPLIMDDTSSDIDAV